MKHMGCFIWCNSDMRYVRLLCTMIGGNYNIASNIWRRGKHIVHLYPRSVLSWPNVERLRGFIFPEVVLDHAIILSDSERECYAKALEHVRPEDHFPPTPDKP